MPVITSIKSQKNQHPTSHKASSRRGRVNIYLDGKFGFGLDLENFVKLGLSVGQELTDEKIREITQKGEYQKVVDRLLVFATLRPRSEKEIQNWMIRKKVNVGYKDKLTEKLRKLELLDDEKFAFWWIGQRLEFKSKSKRELIYELRGKGIKKEIIEKVLSASRIDEVQAAKDLIEKRAYKWKGLGKTERRQKISRYLAGKGFGWETIKKALEGTGSM